MHLSFSRFGVLAAAAGVMALTVTTVTACGEDARPNVSEETPQPAESNQTTEPASFETCNPGDRRECKKYWRDHMGIAHCMTAQQICSASAAWLECGATP
jgi:hypothetical protein